MRRIVLIRPAAGGGNIRFRGQNGLPFCRFPGRPGFSAIRKRPECSGRSRKGRQRGNRSDPLAWNGFCGVRPARLPRRRRDGSAGACAIKAFRRIPDCRAADGREDPPEGRESAEGRCLSADFCQGPLLPWRLSAPPIPRAACGDKGQGAVSPGAPRPGGRCSRPTGGCSRRSRRRYPGPPRRRRGRGPGGSAGSRGQSPPSGCRRR